MADRIPTRGNAFGKEIPSGGKSGTVSPFQKAFCKKVSRSFNRLRPNSDASPTRIRIYFML
jgi:hypothetical protein